MSEKPNNAEGYFQIYVDEGGCLIMKEEKTGKCWTLTAGNFCGNIDRLGTVTELGVHYIDD